MYEMPIALVGTEFGGGRSPALCLSLWEARGNCSCWGVESAVGACVFVLAGEAIVFCVLRRAFLVLALVDEAEREEGAPSEFEPSVLSVLVILVSRLDRPREGVE